MSSDQRRISESFLRVAARPLEQAASSIAENEIARALEALSPASLGEAYRGGARAVAALAGVSAPDVERLLPMAEASASLGRLAELQPRAAHAWRAHAGELGFLDFVTELTIDSTVPDVAIQLERVSKKIQRDRGLSTPLAELSVEVGRYTDLVTASAELLAGGDWVAAALRRKKLRTVVAAAVPTTLIMVITVLIVALQLRRGAIDAALASSDPCEASKRGAELSRYASREQEQAIMQRAIDCADMHDRILAEDREAERRKALDEAEVAARTAASRACEAVTRSLGSGEPLPAEHRAVLGARAALIDRLVTASLLPSDIGPESPELPCDGTDQGAAIEEAFAKALLSNVSLWTVRGDPSPFVHGLLVMHVEAIPERAKLGLASQAEGTAKRGLVRGEPATLARAKRLCALARALGTPGRSACEAVERGG